MGNATRVVADMSTCNLLPPNCRLCNARQRTCTAAHKRHDAPLSQDSDDEVLVPIEDVLVPHPEDFVDAETLGLTAQVSACSLTQSMHGMRCCC